MNTRKFFQFIRSNIEEFNNWKSYRYEYNYASYLFKSLKREDLKNKIIVFNSVRSLKNILDRDFYFAKLLALYGLQVIVILDDGILKHWDTLQVDNIKDLKDIKNIHFNLYPNYKIISKNFFKIILKKNIIHKSLKSFKDKNLQIRYYSQIIRDVNYKDWSKLRKYAVSSTVRFFKNSELDYNDKYVKYYYNLSIMNALLSRNVGEYILKKIKPDFFITSHGIYSTWGPAFDYLKDNGIKSYVYASKHSHSTDYHDIYFIDTKVQTLSRSNFWQKFKKKTLSKEMENDVKQLFKLRLQHSTKDTEIYYNETSQFKVNKNDGYKYHIAIFPNLIWDGNIEDRHGAFRGILDWLIETIKYFQNKDDVKFFIKFHPAEVTMFKNSTSIQYLLEKKIDLRNIKNLELISTEDNIDSYEFIKSGIDLGIVYDGILALEIPLLRIPVLLGGVGGRFSVEHGNFTIKSKKDYFNYLDNIGKIIEDFKINYDNYYRNIVKYAFWYLFEIVFKLPILSNKEKYATDLLQLRSSELMLDEKFLKILDI